MLIFAVIFAVVVFGPEGDVLTTSNLLLTKPYELPF